MVFSFFKKKKDTPEVIHNPDSISKPEKPLIDEKNKTEPKILGFTAQENFEQIEDQECLEFSTSSGPNNQLKAIKPKSNESQDATQEIKRNISFVSRLKSGLTKTRDGLGKKLFGVFGGGKIDETLYEELEAILLSADVGIKSTTDLLDKIRNKVSLRGLKDGHELKQALRESMLELLEPIEKPLIVNEIKPFVIMLVGVNGAGKTTSIGKLAKYFQEQGKSVMLAAGDTFRAAAREQLIEWGSRNNVVVVSQQQGGDSAAVCYDAIQSAIAQKIDVVLADTAGRLPTQLNLMEEIKKVKRVIGKSLSGAPHEVLLVLDSNIGQNALNQVRAFDDALGLSGLVLTKLDGTAKGGVICAIASERAIPLRFIGVGEAIDDLRPFMARDYVEALFE
jgi:fused signal recognition particle receptor